MSAADTDRTADLAVTANRYGVEFDRFSDLVSIYRQSTAGEETACRLRKHRACLTVMTLDGWVGRAIE